MTLADYLKGYIDDNNTEYPEIKKIYTKYDSGIDNTCFVVLDEEEAAHTSAGRCTYTGITQTCDIGVILLFEDKTEAETETEVENIAFRLFITLRSDLKLNGQLISGKIMKSDGNRFNHGGKKARSFILKFTGKYWR